MYYVGEGKWGRLLPHSSFRADAKQSNDIRNVCSYPMEDYRFFFENINVDTYLILSVKHV